MSLYYFCIITEKLPSLIIACIFFAKEIMFIYVDE